MEEQNGFRKNRSCIDHVFVLQSIIINRINIIVKDGKTVSDPESISNYLNDYFVNIASSLVDGIPDGTYNPSDPLLGFINSKLPAGTNFNIPFVTVSYVKKSLKEMDHKKARGVDQINTNLIHKTAEVVAEPLCKLINCSIETGMFPDLWKHARVLPLHKSGSRSDPDNYRPISILCSLSKIIEKHVYENFFKYLTTHNLITPFQSGFMKYNSCETGLTSVVNKWYSEIDRGNLVGTVNIDLSKAFNLLNHDILLAKLKCYGVSENTLKWFKSYLSDRRQYVHFNGTKSSELQCNYGIPQGSILGPLMFILYINDLPVHLHQLSIHMYADDTIIYFISEDLNAVKQTINNELNNFSQWCKDNRLIINANKTHSMLFCSYQKRRFLPNSLDLTIDGEVIDSLNSDKLLGVNLDQNLLMDKHIDALCVRLSRLSALLWRIRGYLTLRTKIVGITMADTWISYTWISDEDCRHTMADTWISYTKNEKIIL